MEEIELTKFRLNMSEYMNKVSFGNERIGIIKDRKKRAVLMSSDDYEAMIAIVREFDRMRELKEEEKI